MRVVHVSDCYAPRIGGIERQLAGLAQAQVLAGHEIVVATATPGTRRAGDNPEVRRLRSPGALGSLPGTGAGIELARLLRRVRPDVVHVHVSLVSPVAAAGAWLGARGGTPTVVTAHSLWGPCARPLYRATDLLTGWTSYPVVWTTVSAAAAATMRSLLPVEPVVVPNAIDIPFWRPTGPRSPHGCVHVVSVGRLAARKRPMDVLRVLRDARRRLPRAVSLRATIVGDGPERGRLERFLARHRMSAWVTLTGSLSSAAIRGVLAGADIFLAPATMESFGIAALEARTAGLAVLARSGTGVAEFVHHQREGLLAPDRDELTDGLIHLARESALREAIIEHNRETPPRRFAWSTAVAELDACYASAQAGVGRLPLTAPAVPAFARPTPAPPALRARSRTRV